MTHQETIQEKIRSAFLELAEEEESLRKITTTQILKRAGVSRSTFYSYYENKKDLLEDVLTIFIWQISASIREVWPSKDGLDSYRNAYLVITNLLYEHRNLFRQLVGTSEFQNQLIDFMTDFLLQQYEEMIPGEPKDILRLSAVGTSSYLYGNLREWARNNYQYSPEELTEKLIESLKVTAKRMVP